MPLTALQAELGRLLAHNRSEASYAAGDAPMLAAPNSQRYSQDLDFFHDNETRVASAYYTDHRTLVDSGFLVEVDIIQPGYIRVVARRGNDATKLEWAQDSSWRFMPIIRSEEFGYQLHPIDLATNKVLALAGRDEPRDLLDTLHVHKTLLDLGPLVWAAVGKDPGFSPLSLLELLRRRGKMRPEDLTRLHLAYPIDVQQLKATWLEALQGAESFIQSRPPQEVGCLYYALSSQCFVNPNTSKSEKVATHFGRPGGVLPRIF